MNRTERRTLLVAFALVLLPLGILPAAVSTASPGSGSGVSATLAAATDGPQPVEPGTVLRPLVETSSGSRTGPRRPCRAGSIALTFDDGPVPVPTSRLVRILVRERVPAAFFMNGAKVRQAPQTVRYVARSGFTIANHTWSHPELPRLSGLQIRGQILKTGAELRKLGVDTGSLMRPPYGAINPRVAREIRSVGLVPVLWTVDSMDWSGGSAREIARRILAQLRPYQTNIVLQHDGVANSPASIAAVPIVIREARARGYCFSDLGPRGGVAPYGSVELPRSQVFAAVATPVDQGPRTAVAASSRQADPFTNRPVRAWPSLPWWATPELRSRTRP